jgi:voltage-gated potassium channel
MADRTRRRSRDRSRPTIWGLRLAPADQVRARVVEFRWRWPTLLLLLATIPAFYLELLDSPVRWLAPLSYMAAAGVLVLALGHTARTSGRVAEHVAANPLDLLLVAGLTVAAWIPPSNTSKAALGFRLAVALVTLVRMVWALQHVITRGGLGSMLLTALAVLLMCGAGYWWLEPTTPTLGDGLWLAFVTASTIGYGDLVPTTVASKIFSFFVVLLGFGVLTVVTAAIATKWVETEERIIEREILRDMHRQMDELRGELAALRQDLALERDRSARKDLTP